MTRWWARRVGALTLGVLLTVAGAALAATPDTAVTTRDGAAYQGVLVEQIPGDHVTIQTADGKLHPFARADRDDLAAPVGP